MGASLAAASATASRKRSAPPPASAFAVPQTGSTLDQGATAVTLDAAEREAGYAPLTPAQVDGLSLYQVVLPSESDGKAGDTVLAYTGGTLPRDGFGFLPVLPDEGPFDFVTELAGTRDREPSAQVGEEVEFVLEPTNPKDPQAVVATVVRGGSPSCVSG